MKKQYEFSNGVRGAVVQSDSDKVRITIRLDEEVIDWFRNHGNSAGDGNYQTLINKALREYIGRCPEPLEKTNRYPAATPQHPEST